MTLRPTPLRTNRAVILAICLVTLIGSASAASYKFVDLYTVTLPDGYSQDPFQLPWTEPVAPGGVLVGDSSGTITSGQYHALLWGGAGTPVDLTPFGASSARVYSGTSTQQVGSSLNHAMLWSATNQPVDLHPAGFASSEAIGIGGGYQVGIGSTPTGEVHALLWNGTNVATDLHPSGLAASFALGVGDGQQVGYGELPNQNSGSEHALLWNGTNVAVDLHPPGYQESQAVAVAGGQQVGFGRPLHGFDHALLWHGTNQPIDLMPTGFNWSDAYGTNGSQQVGFGRGSITGLSDHALLWNGTNAATDLGALLPSNLSESYASAFDSAGNVFGLAFDPIRAEWHAVEWTVPEPATSSLFLATVALGIRRKRL